MFYNETEKGGIYFNWQIHPKLPALRNERKTPLPLKMKLKNRRKLQVNKALFNS